MAHLFSIAEGVVASLVADISDRRGLKWEWNKIDEDVKAEIHATWRGFVLAALKQATTGSGAESMPVASGNSGGEAPLRAVLEAARVVINTPTRIARVGHDMSVALLKLALAVEAVDGSEPVEDATQDLPDALRRRGGL